MLQSRDQLFFLAASLSPRYSCSVTAAGALRQPCDAKSKFSGVDTRVGHPTGVSLYSAAAAESWHSPMSRRADSPLRGCGSLAGALDLGRSVPNVAARHQIAGASTAGSPMLSHRSSPMRHTGAPVTGSPLTSLRGPNFGSSRVQHAGSSTDSPHPSRASSPIRQVVGYDACSSPHASQRTASPLRSQHPVAYGCSPSVPRGLATDSRGQRGLCTEELVVRIGVRRYCGSASGSREASPMQRYSLQRAF